MKILSSVLVFAVLTMASTPPASACSPRHINTPQELVTLSDGIYRVKAIHYSQGGPGGRSPLPTSTITFRVLDVLKGQEIDSLSILGSLSQDSDANQGVVPYTFVRSEGAHGNCFAATFRFGWEYLLFVRADSPYWAPLAPTTEQIDGPTDPWVEWVRQELLQSRPAA